MMIIYYRNPFEMQHVALVYGEWCGGPSSIKHLKLVAAVQPLPCGRGLPCRRGRLRLSRGRRANGAVVGAAFEDLFLNVH